MRLRGRELPVPADPLCVARTLADQPGFAFLWSASGGGASYAACRPVDFATGLDPEPSLDVRPGDTTLASCPRWIGALPYESRRGLERARYTTRPDPRPEPHVTAPLWARYGAVVRIDDRVTVVGDDEGRVRKLVELVGGRASPPAKVSARNLRSEPDRAHEARISGALELIFAGEIYQINLARRFELSLEGRALDVLERLVRAAPGPFATALELGGLTVAGASPELFLALDATGGLLTEPIKGTRPRGTDALKDRAQVLDLAGDPKEHAELSMVTDVERNDLGRIARTGSVRVLGEPRIATFGTVHHRIASIAARLRPGVSRTELIEAMLPSGSVTGAPKIRAMELVAELESERRGLYTGALGALGHDGSLRLAMAIRTLTRRSGVAHYFAGGGIVAASDPAREVSETRWKAAQLERLLDHDEE
ncbi:MAG TPA: anthranilate synthase component I family protein [Polyangiaceae bacterium]|jgi:anthranilate/para-aminobenzoate synthase component I|nr:anthranilate synthase component I family protein [Polyangiaceae bacterium]